jgi:large subunit ribosomal protein L25
MSKVNYELNAEIRTDEGKGASRRLRRDDKIPAIIYGGNKDPQPITLAHKEVFHSLENEAFYSSILTVNLGGKQEKAVLKDLQRNPAKPRIMHMDLLRVSETEKLHMNVPLHFINEDIAPGVKEGGLVSHLMNNLEITCLAKDLPEYLEVDLANVELGHSLHISDVVMPSGVESVALSHGPEHDLPVASINAPRVAKADVEEEATGEGEGEAPASEGETE